MDEHRNRTELDDWLDSTYLLVADCAINDVIVVDSIIGLVESFGKKKFQIVVEHNGKKKFLNLNKLQYNQLEPITPGEKFLVKKVSINGGTALNFERLNKLV